MLRSIVLIIFIPLLLIGCSEEKKSDKITRSQWAALNYLPYNTYYLMFINLDILRETKFDNSYLPGPLNTEENANWLSDLEKKTGIGIRNGISQIYISSSWDDNNVVVAFIPGGKEKLSSYFNDKTKFTKKNDGSFTLNDKTTTSFYFPDDSTMIVFNNYNYFNKVISNNYKNVKGNKQFIHLLKEISIKNSYWMIADDQAYVRYLITKLLGHRLDDTGNLLKSISSLTLATATGKEPIVEVNLKCLKKQDAIALSTAIRTALVMDLFSGADYELNSILKKTEVEREGTIVSLNLNLNKQDINKLKEITQNISGKK